jgi:hypothetical protein
VTAGILRLADPTTALAADRELSGAIAERAAEHDRSGRFPAADCIFRDARCGAMQPATSDVCADWLGAAALGDDPDAAPVARW